ncbi:MAG: peptidase [Ferruginibacter sp.]|nr:peptidase [Ferruginibacter sp.]
MSRCCLLLFIGLAVSSSVSFAQKKAIDPANMDLNVKPGDNFYQYVNGTWLKKTPVPPSKTRWNSLAILTADNVMLLQQLLTHAASAQQRNNIERNVGDFYASGMDTVRINKSGYAPIRTYLQKISAAKSKTDIVHLLAYLRREGISTALMGISARVDAKDVTRYQVQLSQGGLSLPDRDYYSKPDPNSRKVREALLLYMQEMFRATGSTANEAITKAKSVMDMELALSEKHWAREQMRDPVRLYNKISVTDLSKNAPQVPWVMLLKEIGFQPQPDSVIMNNPAYVYFAAGLLEKLPLKTWISYLQWNVIRENTAYLGSKFVAANFAFNKALTGQQSLPPREEFVSTQIDKQVGEMLGQLFVEKYFTPDAKKRMQALVTNMKNTFQKRIQSLEWMSPETKLRALEKLNLYVNKIGYPDKWKDYSGLVIKRNDFFGNVQRGNKWQFGEMVSRLGKPVNKGEWTMTPPTVNAYYSPEKNEIVFPAGILRAPFFDANADDAVNYGGIGAVIGHEMTHGFDDQGRQYDAYGNLKDWWTIQDADEFTLRADRLAAQYSAYTVLDSVHVNGRLTLGENLADLGGLTIAYDAFKNTPDGKSNRVIDGFTAAQRFFISWAQAWRGNILPESARQRILTDAHSPGIFRTNGPMVNMDSFYEAFHVQPGDKMYIAPENRIRIW